MGAGCLKALDLTKLKSAGCFLGVWVSDGLSVCLLLLLLFQAA